MKAREYEPIVGERWKWIVGYRRHYKISDHGRVWSAPRPRTRGGLLTPATDSGGYQLVGLMRGGCETTHRVHVLVAKHFLGDWSPLHVLHWDGDPAHNHWSNLRWGTQLDNAADYRRHRLERAE